jgi:hypothetical protein
MYQEKSGNPGFDASVDFSFLLLVQNSLEKGFRIFYGVK